MFSNTALPSRRVSNKAATRHNYTPFRRKKQMEFFSCCTDGITAPEQMGSAHEKNGTPKHKQQAAC
jgi:hypothetical protein